MSGFKMRKREMEGWEGGGKALNGTPDTLRQIFRPEVVFYILLERLIQCTLKFKTYHYQTFFVVTYS
jgi:hypothetical protein